jgi:hypothetical protein
MVRAIGGARQSELDAITEARYEAEVQDWAANHGDPAPLVLHVRKRRAGDRSPRKSSSEHRALLLDTVMRDEHADHPR